MTYKHEEEMDSEDDEKSLFQENETKEPELSRTKQRGILATILFLQFCSLCADTIIFPFFPSVAKRKGLSNTEIGVIFSSYDFSRCITSPLFGSLVSILIISLFYFMVL